MAIVTIGARRADGDGDVVDAFLACHQRIRSFLELGGRVAAGGERDQMIDACRRIERYFREALPLHVTDEEESVLPRLRGRDPEVDRALASMHQQHIEHEAGIAELIAAAAALSSDPADPILRARLGAATSGLAAALVPHLELEEALVMPAIRRLLGAAELADIAAELRARRG